MDLCLIAKTEAKLHQALATIEPFPFLPIPENFDWTDKQAVLACKKERKDWVKQHSPIYQKPIIPELARDDYAEVFGMAELASYNSLKELLLGAPWTVPFIRLSLAYPCNWELEQLGFHNAKFLRQLQRYAQDGAGTLFTEQEWQLVVLLHDLGKPRATERGYLSGLDKKQQEADNRQVRHDFWQNIGDILPKQTKMMINFVLDNDLIIYDYLKQNCSVEEMKLLAQELKVAFQENADLLGCSQKKLLRTCYAYYLCDGSTYTVNAGGQPSFDFQFLVKGKNSLELWPPFANNWQILMETVSGDF